MNAPAQEPGGVARGLEAQFAALSAKRGHGAELIGWKIGLNSPPVQRHLGLSRPVIGHLTTESLIEHGSTHSLEGGTRVGVEPEIAIRLGEGASIESLGPAIEVVDLDPAIDELEAILAANVFHRGVVLGAAQGTGTDELDGLVARVSRNGEIEQQEPFAETGEARDEVIEIVEARLALVGEKARKGQVIIAGSLTPIVFVERGDAVLVDLGPFGALELGFA